jgi:hypothetical protein
MPCLRPPYPANRRAREQEEKRAAQERAKQEAAQARAAEQVCACVRMKALCAGGCARGCVNTPHTCRELWPEPAHATSKPAAVACARCVAVCPAGARCQGEGGRGARTRAAGGTVRAAIAVLCRAVLCCAVLCCAVLCCAVLCCAVLCCGVSSHCAAAAAPSATDAGP